MVRPHPVRGHPSAPGLQPASGSRREARPWAGRPCAAAAPRALARSSPTTRLRLFASVLQRRLEAVEQSLERLEADRLFEQPGPVEVDRFAQPESGFEHAAIEPADDQDRRAII